MPTIAELEAKAEQFKRELEALKGTSSGTEPPPAHDPVACARSGQNCVWPTCVAERSKIPVKLDLGCGPNKKAGYIGVDVLDFPGVDVRCHLGKETWPWADSSVDEVYASHFVEHLRHNPEHPERQHFANELWRVLKPKGTAQIIVPHWASCRFWGDYTHREPVSEFWPPYLDAKWRAGNAPHCVEYKCDFECHQPGYSWHPELNLRNAEYKQHALLWFKEAAQDLIFNLVCRK